MLLTTGPLLAGLAATFALVAVTASCDAGTGGGAHAADPASLSGDARRGRLTARPRARVPDRAATGMRRLAGGALLYVPPGYRPSRPHALVLSLHGAGGSAQGGLNPLRPFADEARLILLAPKSRRATWDVIVGGYGPDVSAIDDLLRSVFARYRIDARRIAVSGFSDGASYAISLGLTNGDLFDAVIAFSPGFAAPGQRRGKPEAFVSHGRGDDVLPIDRTSRPLVRELRQAGYAVRYREFDGGHTVPPVIAREAVAWFGRTTR